jgi:hypothetical protein
MSTDLPEDLQTSYDALKYLAESTMAKADADDFLADLEVLVAPYRAAQEYVAGIFRAATFRTAWNIQPAANHPGTATRGGRIIDNPPTLLDLVLKAQKLQEGS